MDDSVRKGNAMLLLIVGVAILAVGGWAFFFRNQATSQDNAMMESSESSTTNNESMMKEESSESAGESMMENDAVDYTVDMQNYSFTPNMLEGKPGQTLKVKLVNVSGFHDFVIDELNVNSGRTQEGDSVVVEIPIPEDAAGKTYAFYCSVGNHRAMGMEGTLKVIE